MKYDLNYFIQKFEAIPENKWTTGQYVDKNGCKCAIGHCGVSFKSGENDESRALTDIAIPRGYPIFLINDDTKNKLGFGTTPKQRVVNYLKSLKEK